MLAQKLHDSNVSIAEVQNKLKEAEFLVKKLFFTSSAAKQLVFQWALPFKII